MSWEDGLNEVTAATQVAYTAGNNQVEDPGPIPTGRFDAWAAQAQTGRPFPDAPPAAIGRIYRCSRDSHHFECKHELRCECGLTERLPLNTQEGL